MKTLLSTLLIVAALSLPGTGRAASLRCETELVSDGASKAEVLLKCGEPLTKEIHTEAVHDRWSPKGNRVIYKTVEEWTYNFGSNRLMQIVVFENGALVDVHSGPYGR